MFLLDDRTRRFFCRTLFVVCCALPTAAIGAWSLAPYGPGFMELHQSKLARELGVAVHIGRVEQPRPGSMRWQQVELSDHEQQGPLVKIARVEFDRYAQPASLTIDAPHLTPQGFEWLWEVASKILRQHDYDSHGTIRLEVRQAHLVEEDQASSLGDLVGEFEFRPAGSQLMLRSQNNDRQEDCLQLRLVRNRQTSPATSGVELQTGTTPLPCSWLALWLDGLNAIGPLAEFRGQLWAVDSSDQWEMELAGQLLGVDLDHLIADHAIHHLHGTADVVLQRARWKNGRLTAIAGMVEAGPGTVSRGLVLAASDGLRWRVRRSLREGEPTDLIPYQRLVAGFALDETGLLTEGRCAGSLDGILLQDAMGPLLAQPEQGAERVPVANLVRTLVPGHNVALPANREAQALWQILPAPSHAAAQMATQVAP